MSLEQENARHIKIINDEMGSMRDKQELIRIDLEQVKTDVSWLKRFFWIVVTSSLGALVAGLIQLLR